MPYQNIPRRILLAALAGVMALSLANPTVQATDSYPQDTEIAFCPMEVPTPLSPEPDVDDTMPPVADASPLADDQPSPESSLPPAENDQLKPMEPPAEESNGPTPPEVGGIITTPPTPEISPSPAPSEDEGVVFTGEALLTWVMDHADTGGTVSLGADISWPGKALIAVLAPIAIDAGPYSITIEAEKRWDFSGPVTVTGTSCIFYVKADGRLTLYQEGLVQVTGDGSRAVELERGAIFQSVYGRIEASGSEATALYVQGDAVLSSLSLTASGPGAVALRCDGAADLTYSTLRADGIPVSAGGAILLDTSAADPQIPDVRNLMREAQPVNRSAPTYYLNIGADKGSVPLPGLIRYRLTAPDRDPITLMIPSTWNQALVDPTVEGAYPLYVTLTQPYPETGLGLPAIDAVCRVMDPNLPRLMAMKIQGGLASLQLYGARTPGPQTVYYSSDLNTWTQAPIVYKSKKLVKLDFPFPTGQTIYFYIAEALPDGTLIHSNILEARLDTDGTISSTPGNGDYDGGDAGGGGDPEPPFGWEEEPIRPEPPAPTPSAPMKDVEAPPPPSEPPHQIPILSVLVPQSSPPPSAPGPPAALPPESPEPDILAPPQKAEDVPAAAASAPPTTAPAKPKQEETVTPPPPMPKSSAKPVATSPPLAADLKPPPLSMPDAEPAATDDSLTLRHVGLAAFLLAAGFAIFFGISLFWTKKHHSLRLLLYCALVVLSGVTFFMLKMQYDNKYASSLDQARDGTLDLAGSLGQPLRFLWDGWVCYPGQALTPGELPAGGQGSRTVYLGEHGDFRLEKDFFSGAATYSMTILAPDEVGPYAMEFPHVFGRYRLWINGELSDESAAREDRGLRLHTPYLLLEPVDGRIELLLAVERGNTLYSGLTYPPAFGAPGAVWTLLLLRCVVAAIAIGCALFLGLLYLCIGLHTGRKGLALTYALLCLCYIGTISRVIFQAVGIQGEGVYMVSRVCYYGIFTALMSILGDMCSLNQVVRRLIRAAGVIFMVWVLVYQLFGYTLGTGARQAFSTTVGGYKIVSALFMIIAAGYSVWRRTSRSLPLLTGSFFFSAALLADRLHPQYEPALIHWPVETGALFQIGVIAGVLIADAVHVYWDNQQLDLQRRAILTLAEERERQYMTLSEHLDAFAETRHEIRGTLLALKRFSEMGDLAAIEALVDRTLKTTCTPTYTGNHLVDSILSVCCRDAQERDISFRYEAFSLPAELPVSTLDLTTLLTNLLQNALDACAEAPPGVERQINLTLRYCAQALEIDCVNTCLKPVKFRDGLPVTTKAESGHGIGLRLMAAVVEQYDGVLHFSQENGMFRAMLSMSLPVKRLTDAPTP